MTNNKQKRTCLKGTAIRFCRVKANSNLNRNNFAEAFICNADKPKKLESLPLLFFHVFWLTEDSGTADNKLSVRTSPEKDRMNSEPMKIEALKSRFYGCWRRMDATALHRDEHRKKRAELRCDQSRLTWFCLL